MLVTFDTGGIESLLASVALDGTSPEEVGADSPQPATTTTGSNPTSSPAGRDRFDLIPTVSQRARL